MHFKLIFTYLRKVNFQFFLQPTRKFKSGFSLAISEQQITTFASTKLKGVFAFLED